MINSRNRYHRASAIALLLGVGITFISAPVASQEKPKSLVPSFVDGQLEKPLVTAPTPSVPQVTEEQRASDLKENLPTIVTDNLGAVHPVSINLAGDAALGSDMWQGTDPAFVIRLLEKLTPPSEGGVSADLYQLLLKSGGAVTGSEDIANKVLDLRFEKLLIGGLSDEVQALIARLPANAKTPERRRYELEALMLAGKGTAACEAGETLEATSTIAAFLSKFAIYCHLAAGEFDRADVKYALMEELGDVTPFFASLYARAAGGNQPLAIENADWNIINTGLYTLIPADKKSDDDVKELRQPAAIQQIYASHKDRKTVSFEILAKLYKAGARSVSEVAAVLPKEVAGEEAVGKYDRYLASLKAVSTATTDEDRAAALINVWALSDNMPDYQLISALSMPELEKLTGKALPPEFALEAVKASLVAERGDLAQAWERTARRAVFQGEATQRLQARKIVSRIDMYMMTAEEKAIARWTESSLDDWIEASEGEANQAASASLLVSQMEVLGQPVTEADWQGLLQLPQPLWQVKSNHSLENALVLAATNGQKGATVALALMMIGDTPLKDISLTSLRAVTAALKAIGQEQISKRIALEAFIARGV